MTRLLYLFIFFTITITPLYSQTVEEKFENGKTKISYTKDKDGLKTGTYKEFFENGKPKITASYLKDELNGLYQEFNENGQRIESAQYKTGKRHGTRVLYNNNQITQEEVWYEGVVAFPKSLRFIQKTLADIDRSKVEIVGEWPKDFNQALFTKSHTDDAIKGVKILRQYRYLSDLHYEHIQLDRHYMGCDFMATEVLNKIKRLDHHPKNPGMPEDQFKLGYEGTSKSNLAMSGKGCSAERSVRMYMFDSDSSNIGKVGHRRWCLNPAMSKTGFASQGSYSAMWSFDRDYKEDDQWDAVLYPPRGYFPNNLWTNDTAFSIGLNPKLFDVKAKISKEQISVVEVRNFTPIGKPYEIENFTQDFSGMGVSNCIIFRPKALSSSPKKRYKVTIEGLQHKSIKDFKLEYFVEFF